MTLALLVLTACRQFELPAGTFDVPRAVAVLQPELGGPFEEPVGFVANEHGGQIVLLALKQGRLLTDDPTASFLPANQLATGDRRLLSSIAVRAGDDGAVTVFAGDRAFEQLLLVPYLVPCPDGAGPGPCEGTTVEVDAPQGVQASGKLGWTTTETWTLTAIDGEWSVEGSRSGLQPTRVNRDELPWSAADRRLEIERVPRAVDGETLTIETRSGLTEVDVGGVPLALQLAPDQSVLAMAVQDPDSLQGTLSWVDPADGTVLGDVPLPAGAEPHRLSRSEDGLLLVADASRPAYYEVPFGSDAVVEHALPWPTLDVAGMRVDLGEGAFRDVRFVVPVDGGSLWRHDPLTDELIDVNFAVPGVQGLSFDAPVQGIEAMPLAFRSSELDVDEERVFTRAVAVSLSDGRTMFAHEDTGCLVQTPAGPVTNLTQSTSVTPTDISPDGVPSAAEFLTRFATPVDGQPNRVVVNGCAGIARPETWAATFDRNLGTWQVEGSLSGVQTARVIEDQRYVTDDGAVSFLLRSASIPNGDGWSFNFGVSAGIATATGDANSDGVRETDLSVSGDPVFFYYKVGEPGPVTLADLDARLPEHEGFPYNPNIRPFVLVAGGATNRVGRVSPSAERTPVVAVSWE